MFQVHIDDVSSDDNGQDLANYNFANDGFRANPANPEVSCKLIHLLCKGKFDKVGGQMMFIGWLNLTK